MDFSKNHIGTLPLISMLINDNPQPIVLLNNKGIEVIRNVAAKKINHLEIKSKKITLSTLYRFIRRFSPILSEKGNFEADFKSLTYEITLKKSNDLEFIQLFFKDITLQKNEEIKKIIHSKIKDIQIQKQQNEILRLQDKKYQNLINNMNLGMLEVDLDEKIEYCNNIFSKISGYSLEDIKGKVASNFLFYDKDLYHINQKNKKDTKKEAPHKFEIIVSDKKKDSKYWEVTAYPRVDIHKNKTGLILVHVDITKQKKLEIKLSEALSKVQKSSKAKEIFLSNISHEIRTPLIGVIGMIQQIEKEKLNPSQRKYITNAKIASNHLHSIINNVLDLSKIEAGEIKLNLQKSNLQKTIEEVSSILYTQAKDKKIELIFKNDPKLDKSLVFDPTLVRQILINIVGNALKFTEKGKVSIQTHLLKETPKEQNILIKINDTGIGMHPDFLKNTFTKFSQEDTSISRNHGGTGLGLVITKELVEYMGGNISISSTKNKGTEVEINLTFPFDKNDKADKIVQKPNYKALLNKKILLVEDNELNSLLIQIAFKPYKIKTTEAKNGLEAIELVKKNEYDLILMDLQMPLLGGIETAIKMKTKLGITTPIVAISANSSTTEIKKCQSIGINSYITKPFEEEKLIQLVYQEIFDSKKTEPFSPIDQENLLYDLTYLNDVSHGDSQFIDKMLILFVSSVPTFTKDLKVAFENKDFEKVKIIAHSIKPTLDNLKVYSLKKLVRLIENNDYSTFEEKSNSFLISDFCAELNQLADQIRNNEL